MQNKNNLLTILAILIIVIGATAYVLNSNKNTPAVNVEKGKAQDPKNATYIIEGRTVSLVNDISSILTIRYFGNEVKHDFDGDGRLDTVFILTQTTGGSGTFYYVVAALNKIDGYVGTTGFLLGDRIAPQTIEMSQNKATPDVIVVNYADRKVEEAFTVPPSVGKSIWLKLDIKTMQFGEVVKDFEGEADPNKMTLGMKAWNWVNTTYKNSNTVVAKNNKFTLTLKADKTFSSLTDCNGVGGEYTVNGNKIVFTKMMSTLMYCEGSQEQEYSKIFSEVQSYRFTSKGELVFELSQDGGAMIFR